MADTEKNRGNILVIPSTADSFKIKWMIPKYFSLPETVDYSLDSPSFIFANANWCFRLYPNKEDFTDISLVRLHSLITSHEIICQFDFIMENGDSYNDGIWYCNLSYTENEKVDHYRGDLPKRSEMFKNQKEPAAGGVVIIICRLFCEESMKEKAISENESYKIEKNWTLCQDFRNLFLDGQNYDLTLKVKDKEFRVHRNILITRSHVFQSMLTHDMIEKNSGVIDVPDCEPQAMKQLLLYLYCGEIEDLNKSNMLDLYYAADKYILKYLKEECCSFIKKSLSPSNICDVIQLAMDHNDRSLLECSTDFFVNKTNEILTTTEWMSFMKENAVTANELFIKASKKWTKT